MKNYLLNVFINGVTRAQIPLKAESDEKIMENVKDIIKKVYPKARGFHVESIECFIPYKFIDL